MPYLLRESKDTRCIRASPRLQHHAAIRIGLRKLGYGRLILIDVKRPRTRDHRNSGQGARLDRVIDRLLIRPAIMHALDAHHQFFVFLRHPRETLKGFRRIPGRYDPVVLTGHRITCESFRQRTFSP